MSKKGDQCKKIKYSSNFNYINTPQSFEENIKVFLENGYTVISIKDLDDADKGKIELPKSQ